MILDFLSVTTASVCKSDGTPHPHPQIPTQLPRIPMPPPPAQGYFPILVGGERSATNFYLNFPTGTKNIAL
jgi:hypothetical protein